MARAARIARVTSLGSLRTDSQLLLPSLGQATRPSASTAESVVPRAAMPPPHGV